MKHLKLIGLAMMAAMAAMAFIGAGSASADTLCKVSTNPCPEASRYPIPTTISAESNAATLTGGSFSVTCASKVSGKTTANHGSILLGLIESLTFTGCSGSCNAASAVNLPYLAEANATGGGSGTLLVKSDGTGNPGATLKGCTIFGVECTYTSSSITLDLKGGNPATIVASSEPLTRTGGSALCPEKGSWTATYTVTSPKPAFLVAEP
jgi:hypothetical protein